MNLHNVERNYAEYILYICLYTELVQVTADYRYFEKNDGYIK
jgi:hypothetical protein